jgi:Na+/melibiose symporter-like transporter
VFIWWLGNVIRILAYISAWILPKFLIRVIQVVEHFVIHAFLQSKETLNNRSWIVLFVSGVFYALLIGLESGVGTYYNEFFWQWSPAVIAPMSLITVFAVIFLVFFAPFIAKGRSKKNIAVGIFIFTIFVGPMPPFLRLMDVYFGTNIIPINGSDALWYLLATHGALMGALGALGFVFIGSMSMDIVEQVEKSTDRREEGLLGTINSFIHKLVGAGGVLVSGVIISIAGFDNPTATTADLYGGAVSCIGTHRNIPDLYKPPPPLVIEDSFYQESIFNKRLEFRFPLPILKNLKPIDILIYLIKVIGYLVFIWWLGNVIRILAYISAWILPKFLIRVIQVVEHFVIHAFLQSKETLNNRSWIVLFVSGVFYALLIGLESGVGTYYNEFFWQWSPAVIAPMSLITVFAVIFLVFFSPFIAKGRRKKD